MTTVDYDPPFDDEARRDHLYAGDLIVLSPSKATLAFCQFARELVKEAFAPLYTNGAESSAGREICRDPGQAEADLHPPSRDQELYAERSRRLGMRSREDLL